MKELTHINTDTSFVISKFNRSQEFRRDSRQRIFRPWLERDDIKDITLFLYFFFKQQ